MPGEQLVVNRRRLLGALALALLSAGCEGIPPEEIAKAIESVNREFQADYERILDQIGTRRFAASRAPAFSGARAALAALGMTVETEDPTLGYLNVFAPAPRPLDLSEWRAAADKDLPRLREIVRKSVGWRADYIRFEPEGLQIVITATVLDAGAGSEISLTMRMREIAPPKSGVPRREYPPQTAVRMGLEKIWKEIERELNSGAQPR
jgi:hypothetical protein